MTTKSTTYARVVTPDADPVGYDLDWRHRTAKAMAAKPKPKRGVKIEDSVVAKWVKSINDDKSLKAADRKQLDRVYGWFDSPLGELLRALLLTELTYEEVGNRVGVGSADVRLFERSFFNVRLGSGELRPRMLLRARFADKDVEVGPPLRAALQGGVVGLTAVLGGGGLINEEQNARATSVAIRSLAGQQLTARLMDGQVATRDLIRIQQLQAMEEAATAGSNAKEQEYLCLIQDLLNVCKPEKMPVQDYAPHLVQAKKADARNRNAQKKLDSYGAKGGASPVKGSESFDPMDVRKNSARHKRDRQDLMVAGPDGKPVLAYPDG